MKPIISFLAKFVLWVRFGWPIAVAVWSRISDGTIDYEDFKYWVLGVWPKDGVGNPKPIEIPILTKLRTERPYGSQE